MIMRRNSTECVKILRVLLYFFRIENLEIARERRRQNYEALRTIPFFGGVRDVGCGELSDNYLLCGTELQQT